jgi:hypothetical protein
MYDNCPGQSASIAADNADTNYSLANTLTASTNSWIEFSGPVESIVLVDDGSGSGNTISHTYYTYTV